MATGPVFSQVPSDAACMRSIRESAKANSVPPSRVRAGVKWPVQREMLYKPLLSRPSHMVDSLSTNQAP